MAGNSPYKTFVDLYSNILKDFKEQTSSEMVTLSKRWINEGLEQVIMRKKRDYLNKTYHYVIEASVTDGTYTVTQGSTTVSKTAGSTALPISSTQQHKFYVIGENEVYDVSSFSSSAITLASAYTGESSTSASGVFLQSAIVLDSDIRTVHKVYHDHLGATILLAKGPEDFQDLVQVQPQYRNYAQYWTLYGLSNQSVSSNPDSRILKFYPYPDESYTLNIETNIHVPLLVDDTDEPLMPVQHRQVLYWYGIMKLGQYHQDQTMIEFGTSNFNSWLDRIDGEFMPAKDNPRIFYDNIRWMNKRRFFRYTGPRGV